MFSEINEKLAKFTGEKIMYPWYTRKDGCNSCETDKLTYYIFLVNKFYTNIQIITNIKKFNKEIDYILVIVKIKNYVMYNIIIHNCKIDNKI